MITTIGVGTVEVQGQKHDGGEGDAHRPILVQRRELKFGEVGSQPELVAEPVREKKGAGDCKEIAEQSHESPADATAGAPFGRIRNRVGRGQVRIQDGPEARR